MRSIRQLLASLYNTKTELRTKGVIRSERLTGELGEWLAEVAYGGKRAIATSQKGWDISLDTFTPPQLLQVRSHAKGKGNKARWTEIEPDSIELFDRLIIIVLSDDYYIKEWYDIPKDSLRCLLVKSGKTWIVSWDDAQPHRVKLADLPRFRDILDFNLNEGT